MAPDLMLFSRDCVPCPDVVPPCSCAPDEQCISNSRTCGQCATNQCVPLDDTSSSSSSGGVSGGAVAGAVIASVVFLAAVMLALLWYRKRQRERRAASSATDDKPDVVARAEDVLGRPDPNEKPGVPEAQEMHTVRIYGGASNTTINLDPESQGDSLAAVHGHNPVRMSTQSNPFADSHSIQSASTGTHSNVIPIALVPPGSVSLHSNSNGASNSTRSDLNYEHANVSGDTVGTGKQYAKSTVSNIRNSYMTTGSFASDLLNEAPVIITPSQGAVKQVLGVVKAEVIRTPPGSVYASSEANKSTGSLSVSSSRPPVRSPLAGSSFGPLESMAEEHEEQDIATRGDPFGDEHSPFPSAALTGGSSPAPTATTFTSSEQQHWDSQGPRTPMKKLKEPRPASVNTQAGSIIGATITNASRVHLGLDQISPRRVPSHAFLVPASSDLPHTPVSAPLSTARSQYRMTSAKLVAPVTSSETTPTASAGFLERQQRQAIEEMEATRLSRASVVSSASTRADSILEGFPFVPPSPISDRPARTPPRSPLAQSAFTGRSVSPSKPAPEAPLPPPPNRKVLGMSTASQSSTMSNGLGSFPFQIDNGSGADAAEQSSAPSSYPGKQRASLDTLALTADLQSYPLGFDREAAMEHYPPNNRH
ncbi:Opy2 domain-containing protein [Phanerochaete sordida]|uniref:Opy2 domain-containing protein n=1 Tax=Phanerochaete sordida TaxID=48140 RepID=A0A9P3LB54_9APHY|nr:Opy2 domain-containing protein [Phanerochaete sordida]